MQPLIRAVRYGSQFSLHRAAWALWIIAAIVALWLGSGLFTMLANDEKPSSATREAIVLHEARFIVSDATTVPPPEAGWESTRLPHRARKPNGSELVHYWYKAGFTVRSAGPAVSREELLWLYLPRLTSGAVIYLNGALVGVIQSSDAATHIRMLKPNLLLLPPLAVRSGVNEIVLHAGVREPLTGVSTMEIGPERLLRPKFEQRFFLEHTAAEISTVICLMTGLTILAFWLRRPQERLYGLYAFCLLFWGARTLVMGWSVVPIAHLMDWRLAYYVATAGFILLFSIFSLRFSGNRKPRLERFMTVYAVSCCLLFAAVGMPLRGFMDSYLVPGFFPFATYSVGSLTLFALRQRGRASLAMGLSMSVALGLALHDFAVQERWFHLTDIYLLHLGVPVFLLVMAGVLSDRFFDSLQAVESANERLALRIAERERELAQSHARLSQLERIQGATEERQRIMQDMHDGVGSQLLTVLAIVERGTASRDDTLALLRDCLDDMRLAIDSLAPNDPDLLPALGSFRFRIQTRFNEAGIALAWTNHDLPDALELGAHDGLQVLRILQEALANVVKHARATSVTIDFYFSPQRLLVRVVDDGVGSTVTPNIGGRGRRNMQSRAIKIGALLGIEHGARGTVLDLEIPMPQTAILA